MKSKKDTCAGCRYLHDQKPGHCYMFYEKPAGLCMQYSQANKPTESK